MGRRSEAGVAAAAATAAGDHDALVGAGEVVHSLAGLGIVEDGANRNFQHHILAFAPGLVGALAMAAALPAVFRVVAEVDKGVVALARFHDHVATMAAIASRG